MIVKLLTEHHLEFLSLKGGCRGSSKSTYVKMPHCWKSHAMAQMVLTGSLESKQSKVASVKTLYSAWKASKMSMTCCDRTFPLIPPSSTFSSFINSMTHSINSCKRILPAIASENIMAHRILNNVQPLDAYISCVFRIVVDIQLSPPVVVGGEVLETTEPEGPEALT